MRRRFGRLLVKCQNPRIPCRFCPSGEQVIRKICVLAGVQDQSLANQAWRLDLQVFVFQQCCYAGIDFVAWKVVAALQHPSQFTQHHMIYPGWPGWRGLFGQPGLNFGGLGGVVVDEQANQQIGVQRDQGFFLGACLAFK